MQIDHVVIAVGDLDTAIADYRALGFNAFYGGRHANGATHNALICFADGSYIELLSATGDAPQAGMIDFSPMLAVGEGLGGYAYLSGDLDAEVRALRAQGIAVGDPIDGARLRADGVQIAWRLALVRDGFAPFYVQDVTPRPLRVPNDAATTTQPNGVLGVVGIDTAADGARTAVRLRVDDVVQVREIDEPRTHGARLILMSVS
jgi:catechol 2,3-dioxygenase-like lactoylglutathione lyase family enzyme